MATRYRHVVRKGRGGYYVTQGPKNTFVVKAGPFRTRNAAWGWLNDHPEAYSVQERRRHRARRNPTKSSDHTLKTLGYTLLVGGLTAGVGAIVIYFVNKKLEPPPKEDALSIKIGGSAADQAKAAADKAAADAKAWADWAARGGTWGATPETGKA